MRKFYSLLALMFLGTSVVSAQSFPCGSEQVLDDCYCLGTGTLVADSEPCTFDSSTSQQVFILVDVNDATVDGDADDDSVVATSTDGSFSGVPTGDYVMYQLTVGVNDAVNAGDDLTTLLNYPNQATGLATVNGPACNCPDYSGTGNITDNNGAGVLGATINVVDSDGNTVATTTSDENGNFGFDNLPDGDYDYVVSYPLGYTGVDSTPVTVADGSSDSVNISANFDDTICGTLLTEASVLCQNDGSYKVVVTLDFSGSAATSGFNVTSSHPGGFNGITYGSFIDGSFAGGTGFSYSIVSIDYPACSVELSANTIDCSTTDVELVRFEAEATNAGNQISWATASENNNDYFTVEYSKDGVNFSPIANVNGMGTSSTGNTYSFLHDSFESAVSYYRLSQTDFDGTSMYVGSIETVSRSIDVLTLTNVFPVPASDVVSVEFNAAKSNTATIDIFDLTGKLVETVKYNATKGQNVEGLNISDLATGTYFVSITIGDEQVTSKFIKN